MGIEEQLPGGILLSTVEKVAGYIRKGSLWPATFGLACCAIEMMATAGPRFDISRFGMERFSATTRDAAARNPQAARQDSGDAARRAPRGGDPRSRAGGAGGHTDHRIKRA